MGLVEVPIFFFFVFLLFMKTNAASTTKDSL